MPCGHGIENCDYCNATAAFDAWVAAQSDEVQDLSLLEQIDLYAKG